jgi:hypothetical protein
MQSFALLPCALCSTPAVGISNNAQKQGTGIVTLLIACPKGTSTWLLTLQTPHIDAYTANTAAATAAALRALQPKQQAASASTVLHILHTAHVNP